MMKWILKCVAAIVLAAILFVGVAFLVTWNNGSDQWHASPRDRRAWAEENFLKAIKPEPSKESPSDSKFQAKVGAVSADRPSGNLILQMEVKPASTEYIPKRDVIEFNSRDGFRVGSLSGGISLIGICDRSNLSVNDEEYKMRFFDGALKEVTDVNLLNELEVNDRWGSQDVWGDAYRYPLGFRIDTAGFENPLWTGVGFYNADTGMTLSDGCSLSTDGGDCWFSSHICNLHDPSVLVVIDVAHGSLIEQRSPLKKGVVYDDGEISVEVAGVFEGEGTSLGGINADGMIYKIISGKPSNKHCSIGYVVNPASLSNVLGVIAIRADGSEVRSGGSSSSNDFNTAEFEAGVDEIVELVVRRRPHLTRLIARVDALPGASEENRDLDDLFDLVIPAEMTMNSEDLFESTSLNNIYNVIEFEYIGGVIAYWPKSESGQTVRDYLAAAEKLNPSIEFEVDSVNHCIFTASKMSPFERAWKRMKVWLKL